MTKAHYHRQFNFALDSVDDADIIERIVSQPSQIAYLRNLIRSDIRDERENARLRELTRDYLIFYSQPGCTYCFCHDECRESEEPCMAFERLVDRTNELGIEVPQ